MKAPTSFTPNYVNTFFITILQNDPISDNTIAMSMPTTFHDASTLLTIPILECSIEQTPTEAIARDTHQRRSIANQFSCNATNAATANVQLQSLFPPKPQSYVIIINPATRSILITVLIKKGSHPEHSSRI